jgi:uncharacterized membrane protein YccC
MRYDLKRLLLLVAAACGLLGIITIHGWWGVVVIWMGFCIVMTLLAVWKWRARYLAAVFIGCLLGVVILPIYFMEGHPVSMMRLSRVAHGMSTTDVENLLGQPETKQMDCWVYSGATWCQVHIWFTKEGRVKRIDHDH